MKMLLTISLVALMFTGVAGAGCPSADLTGDCKVNLEDFATLASEWLTTYNANDLTDMVSQWSTVEVSGPAGMVWVAIDDPGVSGHEAFNGEMSKYETTNAQYCEYLNAAMAFGTIVIVDDYVHGAGGPYSGEFYYSLAGPGWNTEGITNGGAARIHWDGSSFFVDSGFENHPVNYVSWYGATAFCNYYGYRLPSEWEWQAVADYKGSYVYGCGLNINSTVANYENTPHPDGTTIVGAFGTYGYGMCDMTGNVWEWTSSLYATGYVLRVFRGGSWHNHYDLSTVDFRYYHAPHSMYDLIGFRVCR
ncbi:MAG: formylglycine-generating enzyme family protein [Phycisphaerae bacterium]|nr:formylglycine-generating enzyme family protein [Phycisphaerae bacterium]